MQRDVERWAGMGAAQAQHLSSGHTSAFRLLPELISPPLGKLEKRCANANTRHLRARPLLLHGGALHLHGGATLPHGSRRQPRERAPWATGECSTGRLGQACERPQLVEASATVERLQRAASRGSVIVNRLRRAGSGAYQTEARMRHGAFDGCVKRSKGEERVRHDESFLLRRG